MTPMQHKLYSYLLARIDDPVGPSFSQMTEALGLKSKSGVHRLLRSLEEQGKITRTVNRANSVRAVRPNPLNGVPTPSLIAELRRRGEWPDAR
jgi:repressor LexA